MPDFDPKAVAAELRAQNNIRRKKRYQKSQLDRFSGELLQLNQHGSSATELRAWLERQNISVNLSTVTRWLIKNVS